MPYVPTLCLQCRRAHLVSLSAAQSGDRACKTCGGRTRIVPSCSFGEADRAAFEELSAIVAEGAVTPLEARSSALALARALWSENYAPCLEMLSERLPGLLPSQIAAGRNAGAQRSILTKLKTILEALATAPSGSGEYALVAGPVTRSATRSDACPSVILRAADATTALHRDRE